jgi:hypothetical protein
MILAKKSVDSRARGIRPSATGKGLVTFGARKAHESLPFLMEIVEQ